MAIANVENIQFSFNLIDIETRIKTHKFHCDLWHAFLTFIQMLHYNIYLPEIALDINIELIFEFELHQQLGCIGALFFIGVAATVAGLAGGGGVVERQSSVHCVWLSDVQHG